MKKGREEVRRIVTNGGGGAKISKKLNSIYSWSLSVSHDKILNNITVIIFS